MLASDNLGIRDMFKWHFSSNSRIIWLFPPCSEGSHIASLFFEETSPKRAARIGPLALILGFFLFGLFPTGAHAFQQAAQTIENIDVSGNRRIPTETVKARVYSRAGDVYD